MCEFCNDSRIDFEHEGNPKNIDIYLADNYDGSWSLVANAEQDGYNFFKIKYCPICGREL